MIRGATIEDLPELVALSRKFHAESPRYRDIPFIEDDSVSFLEAAFATPVTRRIFVSVGENEITGMMGADLQVFSLFNHSALFSIDFGFYVIPEKRGGPVAFRLIKAYEKWASESGVAPENICLAESAGISSDEVHEFLKKMGYTLMGASFRKVV